VVPARPSARPGARAAAVVLAAAVCSIAALGGLLAQGVVVVHPNTVAGAFGSASPDSSADIPATLRRATTSVVSRSPHVPAQLADRSTTGGNQPNLIGALTAAALLLAYAGLVVGPGFAYSRPSGWDGGTGHNRGPPGGTVRSA
jgi:hypothetical protein